MNLLLDEDGCSVQSCLFGQCWPSIFLAQCRGNFCNVGAAFAATGYYQKINRSKIHIAGKSLQQQKMKKAIAKNQLIFLQRCIHHSITPKSFRIKSPIKSKRAFNIMKEYSRKLIVIAKNGAKQRMHEATVKLKQICENLKRRISNEHFALIDRTTEKCKEKEFTKKKNRFINKFEKLKNNTEKRVNRRQHHI